MRNAKAMKKIAKNGPYFFNCRTPLQTLDKFIIYPMREVGKKLENS
ncbi:hypothetical protein CU026_2553 [Enterococcus faecium]|nr:hypothetical protein [Enterococcus faecium]MBK4755037.1 hypothetical protein [Enterococcus faecium]MBK4766379.1 hypothetical protein [Enterococcus faecium]MBK4777775.1 hypothetical protein [Enterococcus faecium]MBK4793749.1 hypothetical protein [Enterococcus faecium]